MHKLWLNFALNKIGIAIGAIKSIKRTAGINFDSTTMEIEYATKIRY